MAAKKGRRLKTQGVKKREGDKSRLQARRHLPRESPSGENLVLKYSLQNAVFYNGKADPRAVMGKVMAEQPHLRKKAQEVKSEIERAVKEINKLSPEEQKKRLETMAPQLLERQEKRQEGLPELPGAEEGKVVTRFAPSPTGPLNISHILRAVMVNYLYAKKYRGRFILRIEDTDPSKISPEYYGMIEQDLRSVGVEPDQVVIQSERMAEYYKYAQRLIAKGALFACFCSAEKFREFARQKKRCPDEKSAPAKNLKAWRDALAGKYKEGEVVFRFRTSMREPNPALRNPAMLRVSEQSHPYRGRKFHVWPLYNYANVIDDHELGVTHVFRGKEHEHNTSVQKRVYKALGWEPPVSLNFGMIYLPGEKLHTRDIKQWIKEGKVSGWDDPKLHTVRALVKRGFVPQMFKSLAVHTGLSKNDIRLAWENIEGINRKLIDPEADRYMVVIDPVRISVKSAPEIKEVQEDLHPDFPKRGKKRIPVSLENIFISREDFSNLKDKVFRLKGLGNIHLRGEETMEGRRLHECSATPSVKEAFYTGNEISRDMQKIQWVSKPNVRVKIVTPGKRLEGLGEPNLAKLRPGTLIQMERIGFGRVDKITSKEVVIYFAHK
jgi:glutamyl-tRNA synthetase